jgi:hypothetical protein
LLSHAKQNLHVLKRAQRVLKSLQNALNVKVASLNGAVTEASRYSGFDSLPDEILLVILHLYWPRWHVVMPRATPLFSYFDYARERRKAQQLCLLNRRFRDLIYGTPSFWNDLGFSFHLLHPKGTRNGTSLERSISRNCSMAGHSNFEIHFDKEMLKSVFPYLQQCIDLAISYERRSVPISGGSLLNETRNSSFPSVTSLVVTKSDGSSIFNGWTFPNLRNLTLYNHQLPPGPILSKLTSLTIHACFEDRKGSPVWIQLVSSLHVALALEELRFSCAIGSYTEKMRFAALSNTHVVLPHLVSCEVQVYVIWPKRSINADDEEISSHSASSRVINIMRSIRMPNVVSLDLEFISEGKRRDCFLEHLIVEDMFPSEHTYAKLRHLSLTARATCDTYYFVAQFLPSLLDRFSGIDKLTLSMDDLRYLPDGLFPRFARLNTLILDGRCELKVIEFLRCLAPCLLREDSRLRHLRMGSDDSKDPECWTSRLWDIVEHDHHLVFS